MLTSNSKLTKARAVHARLQTAIVCVVALLIAAITPLQSAHAQAQKCTSDDFANAVDEAGASLRKFNSEAAPRLQAKLEQLKRKKGWTGDDDTDKALDYLHDARMAGLDTKAADYLTKIDQLGKVPENGVSDCSRLTELKAAGLELLAVMKTKSAYTIDKIDAELTPKPAPKKAAPKKKVAAVPAPKQVEASPPKAAPADPSDGWQTKTEAKTRPDLPQNGSATNGQERVANAPPTHSDGTAIMPEAFVPDEEGYTVEEIRKATRGFFGTISTNLAQVIEHAFKNWGRPTAYVLGNEGGGAFLAGLRYGKGTLFPRVGQRRRVYWHGPSLGYDFGAEGSRTMFLIYKMKEPEDIFRTYTGIDGSAYLVGGVGVTLLTGGKVIMAPIRTGLGLRIGANIGYIRFTPQATWNPF